MIFVVGKKQTRAGDSLSDRIRKQCQTDIKKGIYIFPARLK